MRQDASTAGLLAALLIFGCKAEQKTQPSPAAPAATGTADLLAQGSPHACTAEDVKQTLLSMVKPDTSEAKALANGGSYPFHSSDVDGFADAINLDLQLVTLGSIDKAVHSVTCDGQITIGAPAYSLAAPSPVSVEYQIRPSVDDPTNFIISGNTGLAKEASQDIFNQIIQQIQAHATQAAAQKAFAQAASTPAALPTTSPSFDCGKVTSAVLHAVCASDSLIALDNQLTAAYRAAIDRADEGGDDEGRTTLITDERAWIARRQQCTDTQCIETAYTDRIAQLQGSP